jgi:ATP adenylyltransferase
VSATGTSKLWVPVVSLGMAENALPVSELEEFIKRGMRMSHVYQPLLIRALIDSGGVATVRQLALELLQADESQIIFYENRIKKMPLPVLKSHDVIKVDGQLVQLNVKKMTFEERARLRAECEARIGAFLANRGLGTWDYRVIEVDPVPETVRYEVLKRDRVCVLCGGGPPDFRLEVDHIKPRSKGGLNSMENLQILCERCNRAKSNRDDTSFLSDKEWPV